MERTLIAPGVHLSCDPAEKFNRCRISVHFAFPAKRETATAHALLPLVLERGYADCPDMTRLTKKLAKLYGADLTVDARPMAAATTCVLVLPVSRISLRWKGRPLQGNMHPLHWVRPFTRILWAALLIRKPWALKSRC